MTTPAGRQQPALILFEGVDVVEMHGAIELQNGWTVSVETVTPQAASYWIEHSNDGNRNPRRSHIKWLSKLMAMGEFVTTPQGLIFSDIGRLIDGQNRLAAIVQSGISQEMFIVRNVPDAIFRKLDQGARRSMSDLLGTDKAIQEPVNQIAKILFGDASPAQVAQVLDCFGEEVSMLVDACPSKVRGRSSAPVKASAAIRMAQLRRYDEIPELYADFVRMKFENLPPVLCALIRQIDSGIAKTGYDMQVRAWHAFDPSKASHGKIQIKSMTESVDEIREVAKSILDERSGK